MINQVNRFQVFIKTDSVTYEEYTGVKPFSIKLKREGVNLSTSISEISLYEDAEFLKLWKAKETYNALDIKVTENNQIVFESTISLLNSKFDVYNTSVSLKPKKQSTDLGNLLKDNDKEINILAGSLKSVVFSNDSLTERYFYDEAVLPTPSALVGFAVTSLAYTELQEWSASNEYEAPDILIDGISYQDVGYDISFVKVGTTMYKALLNSGGIIGSKPPGSNPTYWESFSNLGAYYRQIFTYEVPAYTFTDFDETTIERFDLNSGFVKGQILPDTNVNTFSRCRQLKTLIQSAVAKIFPSALYDTSSGINGWCNYLQDSAEYDNLVLYHVSDIKRPTATFPSAFYRMKLSSFLDTMKGMFNLDWKINSNGYFQLIHPTDILTPSTVIDVSDNNISKQTESNKSSNEVSKESWIYGKSDNLKFVESSIIYDSEGDPIDYSIEEVNNNFIEMINDNDNINDIGIGFLNLDGSDEIQNNNFDMQADELIKNNMLFERPNTEGEIDDVITVMNNSRQIDLGEAEADIGHINEITIETGFTTALTQKLGSGIVASFDEIEFKSDDQKVTIKLIL